MAERTTELRNDIEETRARMTGTVDAIGDRVSPGRVAERRWAAVRRRVGDTKDRVMGSAPSPSGDGARERLSNAGASASDAASTVRGAVSDAPDRIEAGTRGNPLAAGAVAFGLGVLVGSLAPPTREEAELAGQALEPLQEEAKQIGQEVAGTVKEDAQQAVAETRTKATEAAEAVRDEAQDKATEVSEQAKDAGREVRAQSNDA